MIYVEEDKQKVSIVPTCRMVTRMPAKVNPPDVLRTTKLPSNGNCALFPWM